MQPGARPTLSVLRVLRQPSIQRLLLATVLVVLLCVRVLQFLYFTHEIQWGYDLAAYLRAARQILDEGTVYQAFQLAGTYSPQSQPYVYPPFLAVLVVPLAAAIEDVRIANWLWAGLGTVVLVTTVLAVARRERLGGRLGQLLLVAAAFAYAPVIGELIIGNVHLVILGLVAGAWLAISRGTRRGEVAAGVLVGLATLIKVFPGILVLWFLLTGRYRAAAAALATMGVLAIATLPVTGLQPWLDYPTVLANLGPPDRLENALAPTVWLSEVMPRLAARLLVTAAGVLVVAWAARGRPEAVSFAIATAVSILIAPALYPHYLAVLVLPMLLALRHAPSAGWLLLVYASASNAWPQGLGDAITMNRILMTGGALLLVAGLAWFGRSARDSADTGMETAPVTRAGLV